MDRHPSPAVPAQPVPVVSPLRGKDRREREPGLEQAERW